MCNKQRTLHEPSAFTQGFILCHNFGRLPLPWRVPPPNPVAHRDLVLGLGPLAGPGGGFLWYLYGCYTLEAVEIKVRRGLQAEQLAAFGVIQATAGFADLNYPLLYTHNSFAVANIFKDHLPGKHPF